MARTKQTARKLSPGAAAAPLAAADDPAYDTGAAGWSRRVAQRPLDHDEQRELVSHLQRTETESARGEAQLEHVERDHREIERASLDTVRMLIGRLPHYTRYARTCTVELPADEPVRRYLISEFQRTATQHRGPMPADPPRQCQNLTSAGAADLQPTGPGSLHL